MLEFRRNNACRKGREEEAGVRCMNHNAMMGKMKRKTYKLGLSVCIYNLFIIISRKEEVWEREKKEEKRKGAGSPGPKNWVSFVGS